MTMKEIRRMSRGSAGFTMIEVLVAVAIMAVLTLIGGAELFRQIERRKLMDNAQQASMLLRLARLDAVKTSSSGVVQVQLDPVFNRHLVLLSFSDRDRDGVHDAGEKQLGYFQITKGISVSTVGFAGDQAIYGSDGSMQTIGAFRFKNARDEEVEVAVPASTGVKVVLRKKVGPDDYREQGEGGVSWTWK